MSLALVFALVLATCAWAAGSTIVMDGAELRSDIPPFTAEGRTMVPIRVISENMDAAVDWDPATVRVTVVQDGKTIVLTVNSGQALVNGETAVLDVPATVVQGRTFVPLRFVSESLGCAVDYRSGVVTITSPDDGSLAYLLKATEKHLGLETVGFKGRLTIRATDQLETMNVGMSGWVQQPDKFYGEIEIAGTGESMKLYIDDLNLYMKKDDKPWTVAPASVKVMGLDPQTSGLFARSPEQMMELMKTLGLRTRFAPDATINGYDCRVVVCSMNKDQFIQAMLMMNEFGHQDFLGIFEETSQDEMVRLVSLMTDRLDVKVWFYINKETELFVRRALNADLVIDTVLVGDDKQIGISGTIDFTDYNAEVIPPDVSDAIPVAASSITSQDETG